MTCGFVFAIFPMVSADEYDGFQCGRELGGPVSRSRRCKGGRPNWTPCGRASSVTPEAISTKVRKLRVRPLTSRAPRVRQQPVRMEDLVLGMYVAEPDGIWTAIGTVTEERVAKRRRIVRPATSGRS